MRSWQRAIEKRECLSGLPEGAPGESGSVLSQTLSRVQARHDFEQVQSYFSVTLKTN